MSNSVVHPAWLGFGGLLAFWLVGACGAYAAPETPETPPAGPVRVAVFNIFELSCAKLSQKDAGGRANHPQLLSAAEIVQRVRPQILLVNEIDYDAAGDCARLFLEGYLKQPGPAGLAALDYPYSVYLPVNTGVRSGLDLNKDGDTEDADDAWGFGNYPGQYGMAVYSSFEIDTAAVRTFQHLEWSRMPGHLMPDGRDGRPAFYPPAVAEKLRLSSKSHWDVPIKIHGKTLHLLASHPTPPVFDAAEDRNGRRNYDEIRLWADYLSGGEKAAWIVDDAGRSGGLPAGAAFVLVGDLNADPVRGETVAGKSQRAIDLLLSHAQVNPIAPKSEGDRPPRQRPGRPDEPYPGDPKTRTSDYGRLDYVLPSRNLEVLGSGVFFPAEGDPLRELVHGPKSASDHNLVYLDLMLPK